VQDNNGDMLMMARHTSSLLMVGLLLSIILILPSLRSLPLSVFSTFYHLIMLGALVSPFLIICIVFRQNPSSLHAIAFGALFSLTHLYLIYVTYANSPHEFGYVGLIVAPLLEAVVAVPVALFAIFLARRWHHRE
jgi:hypothetical protein